MKNYKTKVVGNVCATRKRICEALNINQNELYSRLVEAWRSPQKTRILEDGVVKETTEKPDLSKIPILAHFEKMLALALRQQSFMQKALTLVAPYRSLRRSLNV